MNKLSLKDLKKVEDFLVIENEKIKVVFSTAEENRSFNRNTQEGISELNSLKEKFNVSNVIYLKQVHSDIVYEYDGENRRGIIEKEGDALITNVKNSLIGVFTADCVPVILVDEETSSVAAIHSGWKGTFKSITKNAILELKNKYGAKAENIKAYIGPHIRKCCYEVSNELKEKFLKEKVIDEKLLFNGRNLSMEECILKDLRDSGVKEENINSLQLCTHCTNEIKLHSYRSSNGSYGRLFSFVIIK